MSGCPLAKRRFRLKATVWTKAAGQSAFNALTGLTHAKGSAVAKVKRKHTRRLVPPPAQLDLSLTTSPVWMPLHEGVARTGTLDALLPTLCDGRIIARAAAFYTWPSGGQVKRDRSIPQSWWTRARIDPASDRAYFDMEDYHLLAVGIELEPAAVEALWPTPAAVHAPLHAGGKDPVHNWEGAASHVDEWIEKNHRPLPRHNNGKPILERAVELMTEWFDDHDPPAPQPRSIRRWISNNPRPWWGPN